MTETLSRRRVLARRFAAHGLAARSPGPAAGLRVLRLGVQDTPAGSLAVALRARLTGEPDLAGLVTVWSHRGAPHLHPASELPALARACWPVSDADAAARLAWQRARLAEVGMASRAAIRTVAEAVGVVLSSPLVKGELSAAVTARVPAPLSPYCGPCGTHHVAEQLLRLAGLPAGAALRPGTKPVVLEPLPGWPGPPADGDPGPVLAAYLDLFVAASPADLAGFVGTTVTALRPALPADLVPVEVDGRPALCPPDQLAALREEPDEPVDALRLLPPSDPWLQARDRELLVPEAPHRAAVWPSLGAPGAIVAGGEIVGTWRPRKKGARLELEIAPFRRLTRAERAAVEDESAEVAAARGAKEAVVCEA